MASLHPLQQLVLVPGHLQSVSQFLLSQTQPGQQGKNLRISHQLGHMQLSLMAGCGALGVACPSTSKTSWSPRAEEGLLAVPSRLNALPSLLPALPHFLKVLERQG